MFSNLHFIFLCFLEIDKTNNVEDTTPLSKVIKDGIIAKDDDKNDFGKDLDAKGDSSKPDDANADDTTKVTGTDDVGGVDTDVNYLF